MWKAQSEVPSLILVRNGQTRVQRSFQSFWRKLLRVQHRNRWVPPYKNASKVFFLGTGLLWHQGARNIEPYHRFTLPHFAAVMKAEQMAKKISKIPPETKGNGNVFSRLSLMPLRPKLDVVWKSERTAILVSHTASSARKRLLVNGEENKRYLGFGATVNSANNYTQTKLGNVPPATVATAFFCPV